MWRITEINANPHPDPRSGHGQGRLLIGLKATDAVWMTDDYVYILDVPQLTDEPQSVTLRRRSFGPNGKVVEDKVNARTSIDTFGNSETKCYAIGKSLVDISLDINGTEVCTVWRAMPRKIKDVHSVIVVSPKERLIVQVNKFKFEEMCMWDIDEGRVHFVADFNDLNPECNECHDHCGCYGKAGMNRLSTITHAVLSEDGKTLDCFDDVEILYSFRKTE